MVLKTELRREDILDVEVYNKIRPERRKEIVNKKKLRRVAVVPYATFYFESYETMWYQVQEMLRIEKGGETQLSEELEAYNPLIPKGRELVATVMFEIENPNIRAEVLSGLGGVENHMTIKLDEEAIIATPEQDVDRTNADGKASSVQFVHFNFTVAQIEMFRNFKTEIQIGINHRKYGHMANISNETRSDLITDFI